MAGGHALEMSSALCFPSACPSPYSLCEAVNRVTTQEETTCHPHLVSQQESFLPEWTSGDHGSLPEATPCSRSSPLSQWFRGHRTSVSVSVLPFPIFVPEDINPLEPCFQLSYEISAAHIMGLLWKQQAQQTYVPSP